MRRTGQKFPLDGTQIGRLKYIEVTKGTDRVYRQAKEIGVKIVFGTDTLFDPLLAEKQGKQLAKLGRLRGSHSRRRQSAGQDIHATVKRTRPGAEGTSYGRGF